MATYRVFNPRAEVFEPGVYDPDLDMDKRADLGRVPENIFTQLEVEKIIQFWATVSYSNAQPFLIPVPPETLITGFHGVDSHRKTVLPERVAGEDAFGLWAPVRGRPGRPLYAVRLGGPGSNSYIPVMLNQGNRKHPESGTPIWREMTELGSGMRDRWKSIPSYPPFPWESGSNSRMQVNVGRLLWRFYYRSYLPREVYDVSHLAAQAAWHPVQNPGSPFLSVGLVALEMTDVNEWRKSCNRYGLWRMQYVPGLPIPPADEILCGGPTLGGCIHAVHGLQPCYGPRGDLSQSDPLEPSGLTPARAAKHGGRPGKQTRRGPAGSPFGGSDQGSAGAGSGGGTAKPSKKGRFKTASLRAAFGRVKNLFIEDKRPSFGPVDADAQAVWDRAVVAMQQRTAAAVEPSTTARLEQGGESQEISPYGVSPVKR